MTLIKLETNVKMQLFKVHVKPAELCLKVYFSVCVRKRASVRSLLECKSKRTAVNQVLHAWADHDTVSEC